MASKDSNDIPQPLQPVMAAGEAPSATPSATPARPKAKPKAKAGSARKRPASGGRRPAPRQSAWRRFLNGVLWVLTLLVAAGLFAASYSGLLNPAKYSWAAIPVMTLPLWMVLILFMAFLDLLLCRKALIAALAAMACCWPAMWDYCPLNVSTPSVPASARTFTMLTYNVTNFTDVTGTYPEGLNPTISYILRVDADVVNLQELQFISAEKSKYISRDQVDSLYTRYPYILKSGYSQMLLSKYPAKIIDTGEPVHPANEIAVFRLDIEGEQVTFFNVHLQHFSLTHDDKELYTDITKLKKDDAANIQEVKTQLKEVKTQLLGKIARAASGRARDIDRLEGFIRRFAGPNAIVAGDFNDVPGCWGLHQLADMEFRQVYPKVGFGPMITFNSDRFYFRIDHVLYRGGLKPLSMRRGTLKSSDHYPLLVRFQLTDPM